MSLLFAFRVITFVTAWRITTPAFSVSFFVKPVVTHTFSAGWSCHPCSFAVLDGATGIPLRRVMRTPFARHCPC